MDNKVVPLRRAPTVREVLSTIGREVRESQIEMAEIVNQAIAEGRPAIVEAGTGVGKTWGYLIAPLLRGSSVIVATHTIALQEQIFFKDLPYLKQVLAERYGIHFSAALIKGASNYLCARKLEEETGGLFQNGTLPAEVVAWARGTRTGDLAEAPSMDEGTRAALAVDLKDCDKKDCPFFAGCHYRKARAAAESAQVVVMNHAMLAAAVRNPFLWEKFDADAIVIDEAHQWEEVLRRSAAGRFSPDAVAKLFTSIENELLPAKGERPSADTQAEWDRWLAARDVFREPALRMLLPYTNPTNADGSPAPEQQLIDVGNVRAAAKDAREGLLDLGVFVAARSDDNPDHKKIARQIESLGEFFEALADDQAIAVAHRQTKPGATRAKVGLETFPLNVAPVMATLLQSAPVILTSATISAGGSFSAIQDALGLPETTLTAELASPFDYPQQALLYVPRAIAHKGAEIEKLLHLSRGRAFVLFTSARAMHYAFNSYRLGRQYPAKIQGDGSKQALIEWFKKTPNAVLFATASFWEGVSIEGEQLSLVIIDKLPFPVPDDPLLQAKEARLGKSAFARLSIPTCIVKLKQGFGRLIRTQSDRGMVAILDDRLATARYSTRILRALPPARLVHDLNDRALIARYFEPAAAGDGLSPLEVPF